MASKYIDELIRNAYGVEDAVGSPRFTRRLQKAARIHTDRTGLHLVEITPELIYELIAVNYLNIVERNLIAQTRKETAAKKEKPIKDIRRQDVARDLLSRDIKQLGPMKTAARDLANKVYELFPAKYNEGMDPNSSYRAVKTSTGIDILQPRNHADRARQTLIELISSNAIGTIIERATEAVDRKGNKKFSRQTQFVHTRRTVGFDIAQTLAESLEKARISGRSDRAKQQAAQAIMRMLKGMQLQWKAIDHPKGREIRTTGELGPLMYNPPGQQPDDWRKLKPQIIKMLVENFGDEIEEFATAEGSQPVDERLAKTLVNEELLEGLLDNKNTSGTLFKVDPKKKTKQKRSPGKTSKVPKAVKVKGKAGPLPRAKKARRAKSSAFDVKQMIGPLNQKITQTVIDNMGRPALENRTGRFAGSVRVTDVVVTPQGFPSIGYTYQKDPYQTFEVGFAQGSPDFDPRKLIDRSIREIAQEMAIGRFYTRRV